jgi:hypothetical protein
MSVAVPPELLSSEQREARIAQLQSDISREWRRFAIAEALVLWLPFAVFILVYVTTDAIADSVLAPVVVAGIVISTALVLYWVTRRIRPLQREIENLNRYAGLD